MQITFNITSTSNMGGNKSVHISVENLIAESADMGFVKGLTETVEKFANDYGKGEEK
jgi:hypothetical protein